MGQGGTTSSAIYWNKFVNKWEGINLYIYNIPQRQNYLAHRCHQYCTIPFIWLLEVNLQCNCSTHRLAKQKAR
jgi:hypothetical protein